MTAAFRVSAAPSYIATGYGAIWRSSAESIIGAVRFLPSHRLPCSSMRWRSGACG